MHHRSPIPPPSNSKDLMSSSKQWMLRNLQHALDRREVSGKLRRLKGNDPRPNSSNCDFTSNDYLGLAHSRQQHELVERSYERLVRPVLEDPSGNSNSLEQPLLGATGSRLLSGDAPFAHTLEKKLAGWHRAKSALLCNSGYDANLTVVSSLPCDGIIFDEAIHNSMHMGMRLWQSASSSSSSSKWTESFRHNCLADLERKLHQKYQGNDVIILVESVYSMDGDVAPLQDMLALAKKYQAQVVVDEAHGLGVFGETGMGVLEGMMDHPALLCGVYTFGKAAGCHGAVVVSNNLLYKDYLVNFGYPLIYSTALPLHSLVATDCSYRSMSEGKPLRESVFALVKLFREKLQARLLEADIPRNGAIYLLDSLGPIQGLVIPGNIRCDQVCNYIRDKHGITLFPIKSPTVPVGEERIRIVLHSCNTAAEVANVVDAIGDALKRVPFSKL